MPPDYKIKWYPVYPAALSRHSALPCQCLRSHLSSIDPLLTVMNHCHTSAQCQIKSATLVVMLKTPSQLFWVPQFSVHSSNNFFFLPQSFLPSWPQCLNSCHVPYYSTKSPEFLQALIILCCTSICKPALKPPCQLWPHFMPSRTLSPLMSYWNCYSKILCVCFWVPKLILSTNFDK